MCYFFMRNIILGADPDSLCFHILSHIHCVLCINLEIKALKCLPEYVVAAKSRAQHGKAYQQKSVTIMCSRNNTHKFSQ